MEQLPLHGDKRSAGTASLLERQGRLLPRRGHGHGPARGLTDADRDQLFDTRSRKRLEEALATALGRRLRLELQDTSRAKAGAEDDFTQRVATRFGARIEE